MNVQIDGGYHIAFSQSCHHSDFMLTIWMKPGSSMTHPSLLSVCVFFLAQQRECFVFRYGINAAYTSAVWLRTGTQGQLGLQKRCLRCCDFLCFQVKPGECKQKWWEVIWTGFASASLSLNWRWRVTQALHCGCGCPRVQAAYESRFIFFNFSTVFTQLTFLQFLDYDLSLPTSKIDIAIWSFGANCVIFSLY